MTHNLSEYSQTQRLKKLSTTMNSIVHLENLPMIVKANQMHKLPFSVKPP